MTAPGARLVYITGHGHSGSTLLDLMLSSHPAMTSAGEVEFLSAYGGSATPPPFGCACGLPVGECDYWSSLARRLHALHGSGAWPGVADFWRRFEVGCPVPPSLRENRLHLLKLSLLAGDGVYQTLSRVSPHLRRYRNAARNSWRLIDAIAEANRTPFVVDASKTPVRLRVLHAERPGSVWAIHLVRDGRGLAASEKERRWPVEVSTRSWRRRYREVMWLTRSLPADRLHFLRYEDLCENPETELRRLCGFLGVPFDPAMLHPEQAGHGVGGSRVRFDPDRRAEVREDDRWKRHLTGDELRTFDRVAGRLNARLGYR